jgi:protein-S-isoprenylcysteine O-methyltransferase Ste14
LIAVGILCALRVRAEERMMPEEFVGEEYAAYSARTKRLIPVVR